MTAPHGAHARRLEEQTRALLVENAGLLVPGDGLPAIRARTARPWWRRVLAAAASRVLAPRHTHHVFRPDWLDTTDARCWCGARPEDRTAAPGASGTAAKAAPIERTTAMSHDLIEEGTPRGRQIAAALALAHLLEQDLPAAEWRITTGGHLYGHVAMPGRDAAARSAVHDLAGFLGLKGVGRSQGRNDRSEWLRLCATATYRGARVTVWTHVDVRPVSPYASFEGRTA